MTSEQASSALAYSSDDDPAVSLAAAAGRVLLRLRHSGIKGDDLKQTGDDQSHDFLMTVLRNFRSGDRVLSEEGSDGPEHLECRRGWIVDPLDGTREYSEPPRDDWEVHVALVIDCVAVVGAVSIPCRNLFSGSRTPPVVPARREGRLRLAVSRTRSSVRSHTLADRLGAEIVPMGSAGVKAMSVVPGDTDIYARSGGQYEWDSAAPATVAARAGLHTSRLVGTPLGYNQPNPWLPDLLICQPPVAEQVISIRREVVSG